MVFVEKLHWLLQSTLSLWLDRDGMKSLPNNLTEKFHPGRKFPTSGEKNCDSGRKTQVGGGAVRPKRTDNAAERNSKGNTTRRDLLGIQEARHRTVLDARPMPKRRSSLGKPKVNPAGIWAIFKDASEG